MIGNDVVDLELSRRQSNWRRNGFLEKVFSKAEREIILTSEDHELHVWLLWSMKEAAYKAHQRKFRLPRNLNWLAQQTEIIKQEEGGAIGLVKIDAEEYSTTSEVTSAYIHTCSKSREIRGVKNAIFETPSSEAKKQLLQEVSRHFAIDQDQLSLKKTSAGIPFFETQGEPIFTHFSLSDHGKFSAYSLSLINCETPVKHT
ncbi:4'-phosphopantetheinyl transferase family protein [Salinimicrobium oceani]|uniref:4-phosphopantetheinyl transferase family protein n=1 Tax=Salinimicrobium oceani TaxID=2722702 RepID=A0ABX1D2E9_9FLAO|nr:4'-phosphopantetheinyl transferase superfamily protein [Salinimicrobium oceani]NJW53364.1 4-phosphopantetheinyl transferase family protein [Salinimicrobium oceani]